MATNPVEVLDLEDIAEEVPSDEETDTEAPVDEIEDDEDPDLDDEPQCNHKSKCQPCESCKKCYTMSTFNKTDGKTCGRCYRASPRMIIPDTTVKTLSVPIISTPTKPNISRAPEPDNAKVRETPYNTPIATSMVPMPLPSMIQGNNYTSYPEDYLYQPPPYTAMPLPRPVIPQQLYQASGTYPSYSPDFEEY